MSHVPRRDYSNQNNVEEGGMDSRKRSVAKAVIWQAIGFASMVLVGLVVTGSATLGSALALINTGLGFVTYIVYERVWAGIHWGRADHA